MIDTCLVGYGRIAQGLSEDVAMTDALGDLHTHYAVLFEHPSFHMRGIVDRSWESWDEGFGRKDCEMAVIATPTGTRLSLLKEFPNLKKVLIEKPLGNEAEGLLSYCEEKGIKAYVNYWRRTDELFARLANGALKEYIGTPQKSIAIYTRELHHLVNLAQFLGVEPTYIHIKGHPYREVSLDVWGTSGRIVFSQELQKVTLYKKRPCRSLDGATEVASDLPNVLDSTLDKALWGMYSNISEGGSCGSLDEGLLTELAVRDVGTLFFSSKEEKGLKNEEFESAWEDEGGSGIIHTTP